MARGRHRLRRALTAFTLLTVAGALQALFTGDPGDEEEGAPEGRGSGGLGR